MDPSLYINPDAFRAYLIEMRGNLEYTQADMAHGLGLSLRAYSDLETGASKCRQIHIMAAERLTLFRAYQAGDPAVLGKWVRRDIESLTKQVL